MSKAMEAQSVLTAAEVIDWMVGLLPPGGADKGSTLLAIRLRILQADLVECAYVLQRGEEPGPVVAKMAERELEPVPQRS